MINMDEENNRKGKNDMTKVYYSLNTTMTTMMMMMIMMIAPCRIREMVMCPMLTPYADVQ